MRRHRIIACVLVTVACALAGGTLLLTNNAKARRPRRAAGSCAGAEPVEGQPDGHPPCLFPAAPARADSRRTS